jgi:hypothetical protein
MHHHDGHRSLPFAMARRAMYPYPQRFKQKQEGPRRRPAHRGTLMFGLLKLVVTLGIGAVLGFYFHGMLMKTECSAGEGQWTGTICIDSELQQ